MNLDYHHWPLAQWLENLEQQHGAIRLGLTRVKPFANSLGLLSPQCPVISVAGTNGKGTTVAALEAVYLAAGYRVGTYTSPHLLSFNERIRINGIPITDEALVKLFCALEESRQLQNIRLSYFEMATLAALLHFKNTQLDLIVLEVGMGGRLDATNILEPTLSIITGIDYDHQEYLGNTLEQIGFEKAGILRLSKPFIYADLNPPQTIELTASLLSCPSTIQGKDYDYEFNEHSNDLTITAHHYGTWAQQKTIHLTHVPWHPNAIASVFMASLSLQERLPLTDAMFIQGIQNMQLAGRQQYYSQDRQAMSLFDVSHNAQSVYYLAKRLKQAHSHQRIHVIFSALKDKDLDALIKPLVELTHTWYPALLTSNRAASKEQLQFLFKKYDIITENFYHTVKEAYQVACQKADLNDLIVVYGSFLTVGEVLSGSGINATSP